MAHVHLDKETRRGGDKEAGHLTPSPCLLVSLSPCLAPAIFAALLFGLAAPLRAAEVLDQVPRDALGLVVVRKLAQSDARIGQLFRDARVNLPGPLGMLEVFGGVG